MEINVLELKNKKKILRPIDITGEQRAITDELGYDYWDNKDFPGYQGYYYDGRWVESAKKIIKYYNLDKNSKVLDVGCGKGFLLSDIFVWLIQFLAKHNLENIFFPFLFFYLFLLR